VISLIALSKAVFDQEITDNTSIKTYRVYVDSGGLNSVSASDSEINPKKQLVICYTFP
jgi:hypothetical protein